MSSEWVKAEIAKALKREVKEGKRVLFPVRLVGFETLRDWECFDGESAHRDQFVTIRPQQTITEPHRPNSPNRQFPSPRINFSCRQVTTAKKKVQHCDFRNRLENKLRTE